MKESTLRENSLKKRDNIEVTLSSVAFLIIWELVAVIIKNDIYLPTIGQTFESLKEIVTQNRFYLDVGFSIGRSVISFITALIWSLILGVTSYSYRIVRNFFKPINTFAQSIPNMILIVLALIWFDKDNAPFIVGFAIVFPILYDSILGAMVGMDKGILEMAKLYKINTKEKVLKIYLPAIKFRLIPILISTYSLAFKVVIAGEVYGQPNYGVGTMIQVEKVNFNTSGIFAWLVIILIISMLLNIIQKFILRRSFIWRR
ncbi:ABC transporter permease [Romboutsia sp.]|uniref:ABC transporter permease n=1 Tax=Romboutsia sp. TaxID=1965302 RepID=UPI003F2AD81E